MSVRFVWDLKSSLLFYHVQENPETFSGFASFFVENSKKSPKGGQIREKVK